MCEQRVSVCEGCCNNDDEPRPIETKKNTEAQFGLLQ